MEGFDLNADETDELIEHQELEQQGHSKISRIYGMYLKLNQFEHHFDLITTKYKYMALTWLLANYASIGFMLSTEIKNLAFHPLLAVIISCVIGIIGISLLWHLDLNIYSKFWAVVFIEEIRMEKKFDFLLRSRNIELLIDDERERIVSQGLLYLIANTMLILTMGGSFIYLYKDRGLIFALISGAIFILFNFMVCHFMQRAARNTQKCFMKSIANLGK